MAKYTFKPFSDNIVFWDTEFNGNDPYKAELLSIGMVNIGGKQLYFELEYEGELDPWVQNNVAPYLTGEKLSRKQALSKLEEYVNNTIPYLVSFISPFDYVYLTKYFGREAVFELFHWPPIDFGSILFGNNIDPESYYEKNKVNIFRELGIDTGKYNNHNALDDAMLLREVYLKMVA